MRYLSAARKVSLLAISDPATFKVAAASDLAVSLFLPDQPVNQLTLHPFADQTNYLVPGNVVSAASLDTPQTAAVSFRSRPTHPAGTRARCCTRITTISGRGSASVTSPPIV